MGTGPQRIVGSAHPTRTHRPSPPIVLRLLSHPPTPARSAPHAREILDRRPRLRPVVLAIGFRGVRRGRRPGEAQGHVPGPGLADLPEPVQHLPQRRQAEGRPEPRNLRRRDGRRGLGQGRRGGRPGRELRSLQPRQPQGRAEDATRTRPRSPTPRSTIRLWIEGGALESSGSVAAVSARPKFEFKLDPSADGQARRPPAMPEKLLTEPAVVSTTPGAIVAMAASPWAPLVAIGGHKQVLLYDTSRRTTWSASCRSRKGRSTS